MASNTLRTVWIMVLAAAEAVAIFSLLRAAAWEVNGGTIGFLLWAISPYMCMLIAGLVLEKLTSINVAVIMLIISVLMLVVTVLAYLLSLDGSSSTEGLVFAFVPLYLHIGGFLLLGIGTLGSWLLGRKREANLP